MPPPADFHRASVPAGGAIGSFEGQTDIGGPLAPGSASETGGTYTINSAGYNIWYQRDEFHYLWKKVSGDVSLAGTVTWPNIDDFHDRKVALVIRDSLDDDSRQIMAAQHGNGMVHIAWRAEKTGPMTDIEYRSMRQPRLGTDEKGPQTFHPTRFGIEKKGDQFQLWISWQGETLHPEGAPVTFKTSGPFYVGVGFVSHLPANVLTAKVSDVVVENRAGAVR
ncbi:MAG: biopolymer transporter Tol [Alphaproteobacteria bacterium]|nr:biopolymer transporter Tol [Alphaproteobacteria bacterium]